MSKQEYLDILKTGVVLFLITLVTSGLLGVAYALTRDVVAENETQSTIAAMAEALPSATGFGEIIDYTTGGAETSRYVTKYCRGFDDAGETVGYAVGVSVNGYGGAVEMLVGIGVGGTIEGLRIVKQGETPGLGAHIEDAWFTGQYLGKQGVLEVTKQPPVSDNEIQAITAATISSDAVTRGINDALNVYETVLKGADGN